MAEASSGNEVRMTGETMHVFDAAFTRQFLESLQ
jgi:hypothetical protein